ncbi:PREDICTED: uncharacterized protein LOC104612242 [Nelumbo nucifera]|uniref:Uncharacterized protein LOC104612242 n=2 Tax=Nelumbo nucifera TaxID=4432 RepID=A0A1U8BDB8_NELNU|nr:PREDICTED: uncharacterized protein LOC104612242 [Nelumbo nucifera]XP_010277897.1 PREDICTED: uncharacterized protein LOC104612242 [Nelumbo nucifera]DAD20738.1 TPA_asm: hypothetical protein HUJ06_022201 [Nelumbo nucifera]
MASQHPSELESVTADSVTSSPRSDHLPHPPHRLYEDLLPRVRFMCSFGGRILPRPHDNQLRYVGGETRIVAINRNTTFAVLLAKLSKLSGATDITVKYQLPNEDLDALISVTADEDVENMMEEYDRLLHGVNSKTARLRLFLFPINGSNASSLGSLLDGSSKRANWFLDALNGGDGSASLERGRSEASSILSEVPDYLFGLDNSDDTREPKPKTRSSVAENISVFDPGSPAPATSSPFCSTSSAPCLPPIPDLPPVKTKPENPIHAPDSRENPLQGLKETRDVSISQQAGGYQGSPACQYPPDSHFHGPTVKPVPVYYVPGPVPAGNVPVQHVQIPGHYVQQIPMPPGQVPVGFRQPVAGVGQVYGGGMKPVSAVEAYPYEYPPGVIPDGVGVGQHVYYAVRNPGAIPAYPAAVLPTGVELHPASTETKIRVSQSLSKT